MKKLLKFAGVCGAALALVAFILLLASRAMTSAQSGGGYTVVGEMSSSLYLFGHGEAWLIVNGKEQSLGTGDLDKFPVFGLLTFILFLVGFLGVAAGAVLGFTKLDKKLVKLVTLISAAVLVVAAVMLLFVPLVVTKQQQPDAEAKDIGIHAGWVFASIFAILGAGVTLVPAFVKE